MTEPVESLLQVWGEVRRKLWWERTRQREGEVVGKSSSLTSKAPFEPKVSVCLDWSSLSIMPLSTAMIHYPASLISVSQVRQEAGTDRRKYFASLYYAKHSLHTTTDGLSAHLSWTLNHCPGIHWSKFLMQYHVLRSVCFFLQHARRVPRWLRLHILSQSWSALAGMQLLCAPSMGCLAQAGYLLYVWHYSVFFPRKNSVTSPEGRNSWNKGRPYECTNLLDNSSSVPPTNIYWGVFYARHQDSGLAEFLSRQSKIGVIQSQASCQDGYFISVPHSELTIQHTLCPWGRYCIQL